MCLSLSVIICSPLTGLKMGGGEAALFAAQPGAPGKGFSNSQASIFRIPRLARDSLPSSAKLPLLGQEQGQNKSEQVVIQLVSRAVVIQLVLYHTCSSPRWKSKTVRMADCIRNCKTPGTRMSFWNSVSWS